MRVSIVTISFNQGPYLERCIESVLNQSHDNIEYIVVDAGSTDGSREIIERYQPVISRAVLEPDDGPADGLNKGFERASGDVFYYLNADDELLPTAVERAVAILSEEPPIDVLLGHGVRIDRDGVVQRRIHSGCWTVYNYAVGAAKAVQQSTFIRRGAFRAAGGFNPDNRTCWDGELLVDMALNGARIQVVDEYFGAFRVYEESISGSGRLEAAYRADRKRIGKKILRRNVRLIDRGIGVLLRCGYWLVHPRRLLERINFLPRAASEDTAHCASHPR